MVHYLRARHDDGADGWVIQHIQAPDVCERLVASGREIFGSEPLFVSEIGPGHRRPRGPGPRRRRRHPAGAAAVAGPGLPLMVCGAARPVAERRVVERRVGGPQGRDHPLLSLDAGSRVAAEQGEQRPTAAGRRGG